MMPGPLPSLRSLPSVDRLLREPRVETLALRYSHGQVVDAARAVLAEWRERLRGERSNGLPNAAALAEELEARLAAASRPSLRRAINATGVVIHTNLGRAPLSAAALAAMADVGQG